MLYILRYSCYATMLLTSKVRPESRVLSLVGLVVDDDQQVAASSGQGRDKAQEAQEQAQCERSHCRCWCCVYVKREDNYMQLLLQSIRV